MTGQPNVVGTLVFDVTNLEITAEPGLPPSNVIKKSDDFDTAVTFTGAGGIWTLLEMISDLVGVDVVAKATVSFEGIGADADEEDFSGEVSLTLVGSPYAIPITIPGNTLDAGVYIVACFVTLEFDTGVGAPVPLPGVVGHFKGLGATQEVLSIYEH